jgi:hypothetical protein
MKTIVEQLKHHSTEEVKARQALKTLADKEMRDRINHRFRAMNDVNAQQEFHSRTGRERSRLQLLIAQHGGIVAALQRKGRKA